MKVTQTSFTRVFSVIALVLLLCLPAASQNLPSHIRDYKVHRDKITLTVNSDQAKSASVKIGDLSIVNAGMSGLTFALPAKILSENQSGRVEFLTFYDIRVNGIAVQIEEYRHPFDFKKGRDVDLPVPARVFLPTDGVLRAAWNEISESKTDWKVAGRVFVFGRFRRFGIMHKRVVPVDFEVTIANPLFQGK